MNTWIMPCNLKYFDINQRFESYNYVVWKNSARILKGDIVYIYVGKPLSCIKYKCVVEDADVDKSLLDENAYARIGEIERNRKYMKLKKVHTYEAGVALAKVQELGMFGVRKQTRMDGKLLAYMNEIDAQIVSVE